jgi:GntR family transcriptional regulator of arabinose operon
MNNLLYLKIKQNITEEIKKMRPHERIPSRVELVKRYDVTRTTVDRAISELIGEGYLYARDGSGTYVAEYTEVQSTNGKNNVVNWGVILPNIMHDTYPGILRGVADVASENDINVGKNTLRRNPLEGYLPVRKPNLLGEHIGLAE